MNLPQLQAEVGSWHRRHFPNATPTQVVLKAVEEVAELAAAHNHRLSSCAIVHWNHVASRAELDAIGDVIIVLAGLCERLGVDLGTIAYYTWSEVSQRSAERIHRNSTVADSLAEEVTQS